MLTTQTGVKLIAEGVELGTTSFACVYEDVTLHDVLDSLSHLNNYAWKRRKDQALALQDGYDATQLDVFRPHTEEEAEMWRQGKKLLEAYNKLPPNVKNAMGGQYEYGAAFGDLPAEAQSAARAMLRAKQQQLTNEGKSSPLDPAHLENTLVRMGGVNHQEGLDQYGFSIRDKGQDDYDANGKLTGHRFGESHDVSFMIFADPRDNVERIVPKGDAYSRTWHGDTEDERSRREYDMADARLNAKVTLTSHRRSLYEALQEMQAQTHFSFATTLLDPKDESRPFFACDGMPLQRAVDSLCKAHGFAARGVTWTWTWGIRKSGVLLFHCTPRATISSAHAN